MDFLKSEFQLKNFTFHSSKPDDFYKSQWGSRKLPYIVYRLFLIVYMLAWLIPHSTHPTVQGTFHYYLTNWVEVILTFYFFVAFCLSVYGYWLERQAVDTSVGPPRWFHKLAWASFSISCDLVIVVDVLFWSAIAPRLPQSFLRHAIVIDLHAINLLLVLVDVFVSAYRVEILHFIYCSIVGLIYVFFTLLLYFTGGPADLYPIFDWSKEVGITLTLCIICSIVGVFLAHCGVFCLFKLRIYLFNRFCSDAEHLDSTSYVEANQTLYETTTVS